MKNERDPKPKFTVVSSYVPAAQREQIERIAQMQRTTVCDVIRTIIDHALTHMPEDQQQRAA